MERLVSESADFGVLNLAVGTRVFVRGVNLESSFILKKVNFVVFKVSRVPV